MIVKSMARKAPTFGQLIGYISRDADAGSPVFSRNLCHAGIDESLTARQFARNFGALPKRRNGNALYHEMIVLEAQAHLSPQAVSIALIDLADRYCEMRAPGQLAWGRIHTNTNNPHIHLMISANAVHSPKRVRLEKAAFSQIQVDLERYRESTYPELAGGRIYDRQAERDTPCRTRSEGELKRRTGSPSQKEQIAERLSKALKKARNEEETIRSLATAGYDLYQRGNTVGVINQATGKRYRLRTLGLTETFERAIAGKAAKAPAGLNLPPEKREITSPAPPPKQQDRKAAEQRKIDPRTAALLSDRKALEEIARDELGHAEHDYPERE